VHGVRSSMPPQAETTVGLRRVELPPQAEMAVGLCVELPQAETERRRGRVPPQA